MILTYHEIVPDKASYIYSIDRPAFAEHLAFVAALHRQSSGTAKPPLVTFDDGHTSQFRYGFPLLNQFGVKGIFFVTAGWMGNYPQYMSWSQLAELLAEGHEVQSHGWSHRLLTACSPAQMEQELYSSRATMEDKLGVPVEGISMPGGRWNWRVIEACARAGYRRVYTSDPWSNSVGAGGVLCRGRFMVRRNMQAGQIQRILATEDRRLDPIRLRHAAKKNVQRILGDRLYQHLWRSLGSWKNRQQINQEYAEDPSLKRTLG